MYLLEFGQRLLKKQNIGIVVYLVLNTLIVISLFQNILLGTVLYIVSLVIALSPVGEWILRLQQGCKPIKREDHLKRLTPLFEEVYQKAKELDPSLPKNIKLFITKDSSPNAFATGRKTICITRGLLNYSDEEIKATLAHEFGHLSNKDTDLILVVAVGNLILTTLFIFYRVVAFILGIAFSIVNRSIGQLLLTFLIDIILVSIMWLWTKFGTLLVMYSSRKTEYEADRFAARCGFRSSLIVVLDKFNEMEVSAPKGLWANLVSSHPDPDERIAKLQQLKETA